MADPLSIAASALQISGFAAGLIQGLSRFTVQTRAISESIKEAHQEVSQLRLALVAVGETFRERGSRQLPFERSHHANIHHILESCKVSLQALEEEIPSLTGARDNVGLFEKLRLSLEKSLNSERVKEIMHHISSYTTVLQLSLNTLTLGTLWDTQQTQEKIQAEIRKLTDAIRSAHLFSVETGVIHTAVHEVRKLPDVELPTHPHTSSVGDTKNDTRETSDEPERYGGKDDDKKIELSRICRDWRDSAVDVATAVTLNDFNKALFDGNPISPSASVRFDGSSTCNNAGTEDTFDPEPDFHDILCREILEYQLQANQDIVRQLRECGLKSKAALYQRRGILLKEQLNSHDEVDALANAANTAVRNEPSSNLESQTQSTLGEPMDSSSSLPTPSLVSLNEVTKMKEEQVDILLECDNAEQDREAKELLQTLLQEEVRNLRDNPNMLNVDGGDADRRCRLYHKLGSLSLTHGNIEQAQKFLHRAFEGRRTRDSGMVQELVEESALLLVKILQLNQTFDEAKGIYIWIQRRLQVRSSSSTSISIGYSTSSSPSPPESSSVGNKPEPNLSSSPADPPSPPLSPTTFKSPMSLTEGETVAVDTGAEDLTKCYSWCKMQGLDVERDDFHFDACDTATGQTPVHLAAQAEDETVLRDMLSHLAHAEMRDRFHSTPLHVAAATRNKYTCKLLLCKGANPCLRDDNGMTALHRCQWRKGGLAVAGMFLERAPELLNWQDYRGKTALYMACEQGNKRMVQLLLTKYSADPNIQGPGGCTALVMAIDAAAQSAHRISIVELLLQHDADPGIADAERRTAYMASSNAGLASSEIKRLLHATRRRRPNSVSSATSTAALKKRPEYASEQSQNAVVMSFGGAR